jgi:hypothetical protein
MMVDGHKSRNEVLDPTIHVSLEMFEYGEATTSRLLIQQRTWMTSRKKLWIWKR